MSDRNRQQRFKQSVENVKSLFLLNYHDEDISNPLFNASKTRAARLLSTKRGLNELNKFSHNSRKLVEAVNKLRDKNFIERKVKRWVSQLRMRAGQEYQTLRKPTKVFSRVTKNPALRPFQVIHMDLADVNRLNPDKKKFRYSFILVSVDAFSNYTVLVPIRSKHSDNVLNAIKNTFAQFQVDKFVPKEFDANYGNLISVHIDKGREFYNSDVKKWFDKKHISHFSTDSSVKAYLAESKIGQMKRALTDIMTIVASREKRAAQKIKQQRKKSSRKAVVSERNKRRAREKRMAEKDEEGDAFVDYSVYDDWSRHIRKLQDKLNSLPNTRHGYTPKQLLQRFTDSSKSNDTHAYLNESPNSSETRFEPVEDTLIKIRLLNKSKNESERRNRKTKRWIRKEKIKPIYIGDYVHLTHSREQGHPSEKPLNVFEKKSTQVKSEWNLGVFYKVIAIRNKYKVFRRNEDYRKNLRKKRGAPLRYRIARRSNDNEFQPRKGWYYREELLLSPISKYNRPVKKQ